MSKTSQSLLENAKSNPQSDAWFKLFSIYEPLIAGWIARTGVEDSAISDLTQEVLKVVSVELPAFDHNGRTGAFRNWLKLISVNRCRRYWDSKKRQINSGQNSDSGSGVDDMLNQLEDPSSDLSLLWDREHDQYVLQRALQLTKDQFDATTYDVFFRNAIKGESPKSISEHLDVSIGQIYKIKHRVMTRLQLVARGLIDDFGFNEDV